MAKNHKPMSSLDRARPHSKTLLACLGWLAVCAGGPAAAETWIGPADGNWLDPLHWQDGQVPGSASVLSTVNNGTGAIISATSVDAGAELHIANPGSSVSVIHGGVLAVDHVAISQGGSLNVGNGETAGMFSGNVHLDQGFLNFEAPAGGILTYSGTVGGNGTVATELCPPGQPFGCAGMNANGGTLVLTGVNTLGGWVGVGNGAVLKLANPAALQNAVVLISRTGTLDLGGSDVVIGGLQDRLTETGNLDLGSSILTLGNHQTSLEAGKGWQYSGNISGSGGLVKTGDAIQALFGTNTYTGGTTVSSGELVGNSHSLQGNIVNHARLTFSQDQDGTYAGNLSGSGLLKKEGQGSLMLAGTSTHSGGTLVAEGELAGTTDSLQGDILNNARLAFVQDRDGTHAGILSGSGQLIKKGTGTLTLAGANTYSGGTLISAGTLAGNTTSLHGNIQNDSLLRFEQTTDGSYAGNLSGTGSLSKLGAGTLTLSGNNTYGGGTLIGAGTLAGNSASLQGNIQNDGLLRFEQANDGSHAGSVTGQGHLVKAGAGTLTLAGSSEYAGSTRVQAGRLEIAGALNSRQSVEVGTVAGASATLAVPSGGSLTTDAQTVGSLGNGTVEQSGGQTSVHGDLILGQAPGSGGTYRLSGGELLVDGQIVVGAEGGGTGVLALSGGRLAANGVVNRGSFEYGGGSFDASLSNQGTVDVLGSGTRNFSGPVVNQGSFRANDTAVAFDGGFTNEGAYVSRSSTSRFSDLAVGSTGYLVGGAKDRFVVKGDFFNASTRATRWDTSRSTLVFSGASGTGHRMQLAGVDRGAKEEGYADNFAWNTLTLDGGNALTLAGGPQQAKPALYVRRLNLADGVDQLNLISSDYNLFYDPNVAANQYLADRKNFGAGSGQVLPLGYLPALTVSAGEGGLPPDGVALAETLDQSCTAAGGALLARCAELQLLPPKDKQKALAALLPNQVPSQTGIGIQFRGARMDAPLLRLHSLRSGKTQTVSFNVNGVPLAPDRLASAPGLAESGGGAGDDGALRDPALGIFVQTRFSLGDMNPNAHDRGYHYDSRNVTLGTDYRFSDRLVSGLMFQYTNTEAQFGGAAGNMDTDSFLGMTYGSLSLPKEFYLDWGASYGGNSGQLTRRFQYSGFRGQATSQPSGDQYGFVLNGGKDFSLRGWQFGPYARFEYTHMNVDAYRERGNSGFEMATGVQRVDSFVSDLGTQLSYALSLPWGVVTPSLRVEWEHQYLNDDRQIRMRLADAAAGLSHFAIQTGSPDRDYINLGGSISATLPNHGSGFLRYETRLGQSDISQHIVEAGVRFQF